MKILSVLLAFASLVSYADTHVVPGLTSQDESIALLLDEGLTQTKYLTLCYGSDADVMLNTAIDARIGDYYFETKTVIMNLARGDIRNIPCIEPGTLTIKKSFLEFRNRTVVKFDPIEIIPAYGRMFNTSSAIEHLVANLSKKTGKEIRINGKSESGEGINSSLFHTYDMNGVSYSFWPLGIAVHSNTNYADAVSKFINFTDPITIPTTVKTKFSSVDYGKVCRWNEFITAYRGVKVHAYSLGYNLNEVGQFTNYYNSVKYSIDSWRTNGCPISISSYVLLNAYRESLNSKDNKSPGSERLLNWCNDTNIASMIL